MDAGTEEEIPPDIRIAMAAYPLKFEYEAWRVVIYNRNGSFYFRANGAGADWKTRRNAQKEADWFNKTWRKSDGSEFAVVKRVKVVVSEAGG